MFQSQFGMENGHNDVMNIPTMNNLQMIPFDDNDPEVIARRLKNRERQRRYRARKRQEADMKRACKTGEPIQLQVVNQNQEVNDTPVKIVTRVYSQRNWKKDARRAHLLKQQQEEKQQEEKRQEENKQNAASSVSANMDMQLTGNQLNAAMDSREYSSTPSGRNWKAEARNKRN